MKLHAVPAECTFHSHLSGTLSIKDSSWWEGEKKETGCGIRRLICCFFINYKVPVTTLGLWLCLGAKVPLQVAKIVILKLFLKGPSALQRSKRCLRSLRRYTCACLRRIGHLTVQHKDFSFIRGGARCSSCLGWMHVLRWMINKICSCSKSYCEKKKLYWDKRSYPNSLWKLSILVKQMITEPTNRLELNFGPKIKTVKQKHSQA